MNTPILTSQDAFSAMMAGKNILCRAVGEMLDFNDLDQFPATIFAQPGYEFCVKIDTIEVAGITFTVPLTLDEVVPDMDVFVVQSDGIIHHHKYKGIKSLISTSINGGFAQRDFHNAKLQYEALCKVVGGSPIQPNIKLIDHTQTKPSRKAKADSTEVAAIDGDSTNIIVVDESLIAESKTESSTALGSDKREQFKYVVSLHKQIAAAQSIGDLDALLPQIRDVGGEQAHGLMLVHAKREGELAKPQALTADELKRLTLEAESSISQPADEEEVKRQKLLGDLLKNITNAQTPVEVNAQFRYARGWTAEQCKPLHTAISKRLVELDDSKPVEVQTLMGLIQHAPDLTALDVLEIDVGARAPDMQKKLMAEVVKRRKALEGVV